jgi:hypothetical protein
MRFWDGEVETQQEGGNPGGQEDGQLNAAQDPITEAVEGLHQSASPSR